MNIAIYGYISDRQSRQTERKGEEENERKSEGKEKYRLINIERKR